jgi:hypothetical protein
MARLAERRPCGAAGHTTAASNKIPRTGSDDDYSSDDPMLVNAKKTMPGRLRELVEHTRTCEKEERCTGEIDNMNRANVEVFKPELEENGQMQAVLRSRINKRRYGMQDTRGAAYIEIEELCDMTAMVDQALKASGFTGKEKWFRELPR